MPFDPTPNFDHDDFMPGEPPAYLTEMPPPDDGEDPEWVETAKLDPNWVFNDRQHCPQVYQDEQGVDARAVATQPAAALAVTQDSQGVAAGAEIIPLPQPKPEPEVRLTAPLLPRGANELHDLIHRFNDLYMVVCEAGKALIYQRGYCEILKRRRYDRSTVQDMRTLYKNEEIQTGQDAKGNPIRKNVADVWLSHPSRKQYIHGVVFDPTGRQKNGVLNLWESWGVDVRPGNWSLLKEHIRKVVCCGDSVRFDYLMGWMARMIQFPAEQGEVAVVMRGDEGAGKGTLAKALLRLTGQHGMAISNSKHLIGNFNSHLRDCVLLFADEAFFAGDKQGIGTLKSLITEPYLTVEPKNINAMQVPNFLHIMMASNEDWVVPASLKARRFFVLDVPDDVLGDREYFKALWAQMEAGGYEAMLHDLLTYDLTDFDVRDVPVTEALQKQKKLSLPTTEAWWLSCLQRGYVWESKIGLADFFRSWWPDTTTTDLLFTSYSEFAKARGERRPLTREDFGRFFIAMGAKPFRKRGLVVGEQMTDVDNPNGGTSRKAQPVRGDRAYGYTLGDLAHARAAFCKLTNLQFTWDTCDPGDDDCGD